MDKVNNNNYEYVDLGLPSGTKWATCNVGASKHSDYGLYFQWGDTVGYSKEQIVKDKPFSKDKYKWSIKGCDKNFIKYTTEVSILDLEDDAAHIHMGGAWHMPTPDQFKEPINGAPSTWTKQNGIDGRLFTSKKDTSKSIFIPVAGMAWDDTVLDRGRYGKVWLSMLSTSYDCFGQEFALYSDSVFLYYGYRYRGRSVRGVIG